MGKGKTAEKPTTGMVTVDAAEYARLLAAARGERLPAGFYTDSDKDAQVELDDPTYDAARAVRVTDDGNRIDYVVKRSGWVQITINLRLRKGHRPAAGFGGYRGVIRGIFSYFRSALALADFKWLESHGMTDADSRK